MAKGNRIQVILECTEKPGSSRYVTMKNRRNTTERLELKKYNPVLRKHTVHKEIKQVVIMAKKQAFGEEAQALKAAQRKMAKVIISSKNERGKYAFKETMIDQDSVKDFIQKTKV